ncbi:AAA family ATPase [uncultured Draconibacterium sp.]|uniref:AAA family ATPase n=1 Tax=uncultured Draconibacterium sp. TaxID=1573823 RepID=UPI002AA79E7C|nr:AAA family ATPase [uncultured Draconibacterium sp.]
MIIKSISIKNFKSYYNENVYSFSDGLNIISGHEGAGKSNMFDAFMWALFFRLSNLKKDVILDESNVSYINDRIKNEYFISSSDKTIECEVKVQLEIKKGDELRTYEIVRRKIIFLNKDSLGRNFYERNVWSYEKSELQVSWQDKNFNQREFEGRNAEGELDRIFPEKIRKYIWFQGEQLNELLDFDNKETLRKAVDYISYLSTYENMESVIRNVNNFIDTKVKNKISSNTREKNKFKKLSDRLEQLETNISEAKAKKIKYESDLKELEEEETVQNDKLAVLAGFPELKSKEGQLIGKVESLKNEVSNLNQKEKELFVQKWMFKGTDELYRQAEKEIDKFVEYRLNLISDNDKQLEEGVPGDGLIRKMIKKQHCIICDREALKGSPEYISIVGHLDANKKLKPRDPEIEALYEKVLNLKGKTSQFLFKLKDINKEIQSHKALIANKQIERNKSNSDLKIVREKIKEIIREKGHEVLKMNPANINSTLKRIREDKSKLQKYIFNNASAIQIYSSEKVEKYNEITKLKDPKSGEILEQKLKDYVDHIEHLIKDQTRQEKIELIKSIEHTANEIQRNIAEINNVVIVKVKINPDDYSIDFVDAAGNPNDGHGAQNTLAKMSIINAIVRLSNEKKGEDYPFIADAPTSEFGKEFTDRFLESIANTYKQVIIITKDLVKDINRYKKLSFVSKVDEIEKECIEEVALSTNSITVKK